MEYLFLTEANVNKLKTASNETNGEICNNKPAFYNDYGNLAHDTNRLS